MTKTVDTPPLSADATALAVLDAVAILVGVVSPEGVVVDLSGSALRTAGLTPQDVLGVPLGETFWWGYEASSQARLRDALSRARNGAVCRFDVTLRAAEGQFVDTDCVLRPLLDDAGTVCAVAVAALEVSHRTRAERNASFLASVSLELVRLNGIEAIIGTVAPLLGDHLGLSRCVFCEISESGGEALVLHDWHRDNMPTVSGVYQLGDYLSEDFQRASRAGEVFVVQDATSDTRCDAAGYQALGVGAFVCVPLVQNERWRFLLCVYHDAAHAWRDDEIDVTRELATRILTRSEHLRDEAALRASKETLDFALESAEVGHWDLDLIRDTSHRSLRHDQCFGYATAIPHAEWGAKRFLEHIHPADRDEVQRLFQEAITTRKLWRCECRVIWPDGSVHWLAVQGSISRNENDEPTRMLGIVSNISERRRGESLQAAQKRSLELLAEDAPLDQVLETLVETVEAHSLAGVMGSILLLDDDGIHLRHGSAPHLPQAYNRAIDGLAIGDGVGSCGTAAYSKRPVYVADIATHPYWAEFRDLALSHGLRACWSTPIMSSGGAVLGIFAMYYPQPREPDPRELGMLDIVTQTTALVIQRIQDQKRLRDSEERFRAVADNLPQLAWMANENGTIDWFNQRWIDFTGTELADNQGEGWKAVHHPDHLASVSEKFERHLREGKDWEDTFPLRGKDGSYRWFLSRMNVIRDETGKVMRFFGTNTDVTEQREMAEHLRELTAELSSADRRKDEFLATLAHELRNPLAPLVNAIELMKRDIGDPTAHARARAMMERQVKHMVRLIDDLLDVSRITCNKLELKKQPIDLGTCVRDAVETIQPLADAAGHALTVTLPAEPVYLQVDPARLTQVFGNLLTNACKFTAPGGRIELTAAMQTDAREVRISVRDNGVGIPPTRLAEVFDLFTQVDNSPESGDGLGIGLSLVRRLVELHGGRVTAHSEGLGMGSEFVVVLPAGLTSPASDPVGMAPPTVPAGSAPRVLVVDDNHDSAESLAMLLMLDGSETETAGDGDEAVAKAEQFRPDLILLDIGLPRRNGYEVCRFIRQQAWGENMVIVALTGWGQHKDKDKTRAAGFNAHMVKPIDQGALSALLASIIPAAEAK